MSVHCCQTPRSDEHRNNAAYKKVLWIVLAFNAAMFLVELGFGFAAGSVSLQADALDFFGVLLAAAGVIGTSQGWPDRVVAVVMAVLALQGAWVVTRSAFREQAGARA